MYERAAPILRASAAFDIFIAVRNSSTFCSIPITTPNLPAIASKATLNFQFSSVSSHFLLTLREHLLDFTWMEAQEPTAAPRQFIRRLKTAMNGQGLSLRQLADKTGVSPAYLSRLFNEERGLPADETITRLEEILDIPRGALFDAAGRHDHVAAKFFRKHGARPLMRVLAPLTEEQLAAVQKFVEDFPNKQTSGTK